MYLYRPINKKEVLVADLLDALRNKAVLLELNCDPIEKECYVHSFAYVQNQLYIYSPSHVLVTSGLVGEEVMEFSSSQEWREAFNDEDVWVSIYSDDWCQCEYSTDEAQIKVLLKKQNTELYIADEAAPNFRGPIEIEFLKWWILENDTFHFGTIAKNIDGFEIGEGGTLWRYNGNNEGTLVIPNCVKRIGDSALSHKKFKHVVLPEGIVDIGNSAFEQCRNLEDVVIPDSVETIGHSTFHRCSKLKNIIIPNKVTYIGDYTFCGCTNLENVSMHNNIKEIGSYAFYDCKNLKQINIPSHTKIGYAAFSGCRQELEDLSPRFRFHKNQLIEADNTLSGDVIIPKNIRVINTKAIFEDFTEYDIRTLYFPKSLTKIEKQSLPRGVQYIIFEPGDRVVNCYDDILRWGDLKLVFHIGRNLKLHNAHGWGKTIFVSLESDSLRVEGVYDNQKYYDRFIISSEVDIELLISKYELSEIPVIEEYLSNISFN